MLSLPHVAPVGLVAMMEREQEIRAILRTPPVVCGCAMPCNHWTPNHEDTLVTILLAEVAQAVQAERERIAKIVCHECADGDIPKVDRWGTLRHKTREAFKSGDGKYHGMICQAAALRARPTEPGQDAGIGKVGGPTR